MAKTKENNPRNKIKKKGGRPQKSIDWEQVKKLAGLHCTGEEIAGFLGIDYDTLCARIKGKYKQGFSDWYKKHSSKGKVSLRRKQYEIAVNGSVPMLIWLGKNVLGQSGKVEQENTNTINIQDEFKKLADSLEATEIKKPNNES